MSRITVVGSGYVGLTTAACFADLGNQVIALDIDAARIAGLRRGKVPFYEPGLGELLQRNSRSDRLTFTTDYDAALRDAEFVFLAVGTPMGKRGDADVSHIKAAARAIGERLTHPVVVVNKSTVPIGTGDLVTGIIQAARTSEATFAVVSNPEFLREGSAIADFMGPDRVVLGAHDPEAAQAVAELYRPLEAPVLITSLYTAEMIKYASNAFLATKISFINEMARICEVLEADVQVVADGMGMDRRIGRNFLDAGIGYGGSCFPKDVKALARMAQQMGYHPELLQSVMDINADQRQLVVERLRELLGGLRGQVVGILGLAFKPNTDDIRDAPSLDIVEALLSKGARVQVYDPAAMANARPALGPGVVFARDAYGAARKADAIAVLTEWNEFRGLDLDRLRRTMRRPVVVDGRNIWEPAEMRERGFVYKGIGR
ncbi:MAG TPA: UDP-glucose/GDP-mannose dehydrogenase family protein [Candidatus Dormibacteraeota bacterium]|nr:UDP-glucose/GDP-mannose dehydrogenase family protein [Candidatus Dormibacteraeota bacterium]